MFSAAVTLPDTRQQFISTIAKWLHETPTNLAFTDLHDTIDGKYALPLCRCMVNPIANANTATRMESHSPRDPLWAPCLRLSL
jgi:hypothetical protein